MRAPSNRGFIALLIFALSLFVFCRTLCPVVAPRDSGELTTAAYALGVPHPPGYPLYTMLGKLFTLVPHGSIAWRVNLLSAVCGAATASLTFLLISGLTQSLLAGAVAALLLAFSPLFWWQAVVAEVFQLNLLFTVSTVSLIVWWAKTKERKQLLIFAFSYGLSLAHHHTTLLLAPGFLYYIWANDRALFRQGKTLLACASVFALGLLPYAYLPLRSLADPYLDWGNPQTLNNFFRVVTRAQFGALKLDPSLPNAAFSLPLLLAQTRIYLGWLFDGFLYLGGLIGLYGGLANYKADRRLFWFLLLLFVCTGPLFIFLSRYPLNNPYYYLYCSTMLSRFMLPSLFIFSIWVGFGLTALLALVKGERNRFIIFLLLLASPCLSLSLHYSRADKSRFYFVDDLARNILLSVKPHGLIICQTDNALFSLWYLQGVEELRPDVTIVDGHSCSPETVTANLGRRPIYFDVSRSPRFRRFLAQLAPAGVIYELLPTAAPNGKLAALRSSRTLWARYLCRSPLEKADLTDYYQLEIINLYAEARNFSGITYALTGRYAAAKQEFLRALTLLPDQQNALANLDKLAKIFGR
ncbi:MAG: DUF2723 domain-containing protein [Candidatus Margulisbacteria bacterium]|jgi:hypothetical protein|nr:DUF2723 domain-containing protein [Candidatus Margulisiibacteriota bacterium]